MWDRKGNDNSIQPTTMSTDIRIPLKWDEVSSLDQLLSGAISYNERKGHGNDLNNQIYIRILAKIRSYSKFAQEYKVESH